MRDDGLTDVHTVVHAESWTGGRPGCRLISLTIEQFRRRLLAADLADHQLDQVHELLSNPALVLAGYPLYSASGRHPAR